MVAWRILRVMVVAVVMLSVSLVVVVVAAAAVFCGSGAAVAVVAADSSKEDTFYYPLFLQPNISAIIYFLLPVAYSKLSQVMESRVMLCDNV